MLTKNITTNITTYITIYIIIINIITYITYAYDKNQAKNHKWRVRESTLLLLALFMGSIGALTAMYTLRHKTKHKKFTLGIPLLLFINILTLFLMKMYILT